MQLLRAARYGNARVRLKVLAIESQESERLKIQERTYDQESYLPLLHYFCVPALDQPVGAGPIQGEQFEFNQRQPIEQDSFEQLKKSVREWVSFLYAELFEAVTPNFLTTAALGRLTGPVPSSTSRNTRSMASISCLTVPVALGAET